MKTKTKKIRSRFPGVRFYEHETRKHKGKPDKYFSIRYSSQGKLHEEALGWASDGWSEELAHEKLSELKKAIRTGEGPTSLKAKRELQRLNAQKEFREKLRKERENLTFNQTWDKYIKYQESNVSERSYKREKSLFNLWIKPTIGFMPLKNINHINLQKIKTSMEKEGRSARSVSYALDVIRQVYNFAIKNKLTDVTSSPTKGFKKPKQDNKRFRFLTADEAEK